jgi:hypothetical protein
MQPWLTLFLIIADTFLVKRSTKRKKKPVSFGLHSQCAVMYFAKKRASLSSSILLSFSLFLSLLSSCLTLPAYGYGRFDADDRGKGNWKCTKKKWLMINRRGFQSQFCYSTIKKHSIMRWICSLCCVRCCNLGFYRFQLWALKLRMSWSKLNLQFKNRKVRRKV